MKSKEELQSMLKEAETDAQKLNDFAGQCALLNLQTLQDEFYVLKRFYAQRVELLKEVMGIDPIPF